MLPRDVAQTLATKLDMHAITPKEAREHAKRWYQVTLTGRTREQVIRSMFALVTQAELRA